jgi:kynurenine formamidase
VTCDFSSGTKRASIRRLTIALVLLGAVVARGAPPAPKAKAGAKAAAKPVLSLEQSLAEEKDPLRRESAAQVLGLRGDPASVPLLQRALAKDANLWVRARAAEALGQLGSRAGIAPLTSALAAEKDQRVRRSIATALLRLGQEAGLKELVWQLRAGTNYVKAEVMQTLVSFTGQPLGQDAEAWWAYFRADGARLLAGRPGGSPVVLELPGVAPAGGKTPRGPFLHAKSAPATRQLPAVVLRLEPTRRPIGRPELEAHERRRGRIPDGCLLLIRSAWREAKALPPPAPRAPGQQPAPAAPPLAPGEPHLTLDGARFLLERAPGLLGLGLDASALDPAAALDRPVRSLLVSRGKLALEAVGDLDLLQEHGTRLLVVGLGGERVRLLALLP